MEKKLCFATNNPGKLQEIRSLLEGVVEIVSLQDIGCTEELPETQDTLEGNSLQKASYIWEKYRISCFADDTGLEVEALQGAPGVYSARFSGPEANPEKNMQLLLQKMEGEAQRQAQFRTCITLIEEDGTSKQFEGIVKGKILLQKQGEKGFGYDPVFSPEGTERSFAEMTQEEKNKISHRGQAIQALVKFLKG
jgi:XTP/dITP diphosphohydrolase